MNVTPLTKWLYVGGEDGFNLRHTVVEVDLSLDPKMPWISSWSDVFQNDSYDGEPDHEAGMTWHGPLNLFLKAFKPLGGPSSQHA